MGNAIKLKTASIMGLIFTVSVMIFYYGQSHFPKNEIVSKPNSQNANNTTLTQKPNNYPKILYFPKDASGYVASEPREHVPDQCTLRRNAGGEIDTIFSDESCDLNILKWEDYLIYPEVDGLTGNEAVLFAYNIETGRKTKIYDLNEHLDDFRDNRKPYSVSLGNIYNSTLYFGAGGYITDMGIYSIDLKAIKSKPKLVSVDDYYSSIIYAYGHYWISGMIGDGGFTSNKRALFDIEKQKVVGQEIKTSSDIGIGTAFIGAKGTDAFIASYVRNPKPKSGDDELEPMLSEIYSVSLMKKEKHASIISKSKMPARIREVVYREDKKYIVLLGDSAYKYDLDNKKISRITELKGVDFNNTIRYLDGEICLSGGSKLDLENRTVVTDEKKCRWPDQGESLQAKIKSFGLPSEYSFEYIKGE